MSKHDWSTSPLQKRSLYWVEFLGILIGLYCAIIEILTP